MPVCEFCNTSFTNKGNMLAHQKKAAYCLALRPNEYTPSEHACSHCSKIFTCSASQSRHELICRLNPNVNTQLEKELKAEAERLKAEAEKNSTLISSLHDRVKELNEQVKELQNKNQELALAAICRPTTTTTTTSTTNNYIQRLEMVTDEHFKSQASNLTLDHIQKGADGYAEYALEYPLKDRVVCVDYSRRKVKYKDSNGKVQTDPEMGELATKLFQSIKDKNKELIMTYGNELQDRFGDKMGTIVELLEHKTNVDKGSEGEKSDLYLDVVKAICGKTVV